jgi:CRP-like cAMP-binding protein
LVAKGKKPFYLVEGSIFGELDILSNRNKTYTHFALIDSILLSINRTEFLNCLEDEDFKSQVVNIAREREKY